MARRSAALFPNRLSICRFVEAVVKKLGLGGNDDQGLPRLDLAIESRHGLDDMLHSWCSAVECGKYSLPKFYSFIFSMIYLQQLNALV